MGGGSVEEWTLDRECHTWMRKVVFRFGGGFILNNLGVLGLLGRDSFDQFVTG